MVTKPVSARTPSPWQPLWTVLGLLGSLKFTVGLFASSIFLILVGTLAQSTLSMWDVIDKYFRAGFCWVELGVFAPVSFVPNPPKGEWYKTLTGLAFPFFGGKSIGIGMFINLGSAYVLMFRRAIRARMQGRRLTSRHLAGGVALLGLGSIVTWAVINAGNEASGVQDQPLLGGDALMVLMKWSVGLATLAMSGYSAWHFKQWQQGKRTEDRLVLVLEGIASLILIGATAVSFGLGLDAPSLRILWQLIQATFAGLVLLGGFWMIAGRKAGVLLIHFGVALMMFSELWVSLYAVEERFTMEEGKSSNFAIDIRSVELAVIDRSDEEHDSVVVIPGTRLETKKRVSDKALPFDFQVIEYIKNAPSVVDAPNPKRNLADAGIGLHYAPEAARESAGADTDGGADHPAIYVRLFDKKSKKPIATHLLSTFFSLRAHAERVTVGDTTYDMYLRFKRSYKPYRVLLRDAIRTNYAGSSTPRDYASEVTVISDDETREHRIWMNNPLRYSGETLYQSGHFVETGGVEVSVLQVVTNNGWMIPYVSCMLVFVGMFFHFVQLLIAFLRRKAREAPAEAILVNPYDAVVDVAAAKGFKDVEVAAPLQPVAGRSAFDYLFPAIAALVAIALLGGGLSKARQTEPGPGEFDTKSFGALPVSAEGRIKPIDTLARNTLIALSGKNSVKHGGKVKEYADPTQEKKGGKKKKLSEAVWPKEEITLTATEWLLETVSNEQKAKKYRVFRIENLALLSALELPRRKGYRYSFSEFDDKLPNLREPLVTAFEKSQKDKSQLDTFERKLLEFNSKIQTFRELQVSFRKIEYFSDPSNLAAEDGLDRLDRELKLAQSDVNTVLESDPPLACPPMNSDAEIWLLPMDSQRANQGNEIYNLRESIPLALRRQYKIDDLKIESPNPFPEMLFEILVAFDERETGEFNRSVRRYHEALSDHEPLGWHESKNGLEAYINRSKILHYSGILYIFAFVLTFLSWLGLQKSMGRAATTTILLAFTAHSLLLLARIYISGRPPVTNLYSSAVFIGWGGILFGVVLEWLFKIGIGNAVAAFSGFSSAWIASFLETNGGDTMGVLSAVLDTQFWLATHVVLVTLGYTATFVAGAIGTIFILMGVCTPALTKDVRKNAYRMMYGTVCFAIFFSFIGTVLGGLWADDSWGRFWGWDPKENGALIIVLWNCLVMHARWGGMVKDRGFAILCVMGNVCTAWSWFGVNELGIGLHNYGFTEGVLKTLIIYAVSQMGLVAVGLVPARHWQSARAIARS